MLSLRLNLLIKEPFLDPLAMSDKTLLLSNSDRPLTVYFVKCIKYNCELQVPPGMSQCEWRAPEQSLQSPLGEEDLGAHGGKAESCHLALSQPCCCFCGFQLLSQGRLACFLLGRTWSMAGLSFLLFSVKNWAFLVLDVIWWMNFRQRYWMCLLPWWKMEGDFPGKC